MGISRDSVHKRRATGGKRKAIRKKRKFEMGRPAAMTKIGTKRIRVIRGRGGNLKYRALRLDSGNFSWGSEAITRKTRILGVSYNASNNELVRTNTLVKNSIIQIDATPFRQWYEQFYGVHVGKKKKTTTTGTEKEETKEVKKSKHLRNKINRRQKTRVLEKPLEDQFTTGRLYACISSRPGHSGRADGYILEGKELEFYLKKMQKKNVS